MTPGQRIKKVRESRDITQQELGEMAGVAYRTVYAAERDVVKRSTMRKLYDALGLDSTELYEEQSA
jgi:transcriptional regulator with XRE-family HTH domain